MYLDIFYLTFGDDYSEENLEQIKKVAHPNQRVTTVSDIPGIFNAHKSCSERSTTDYFFVVDGDAFVLDDFDFSYIPSPVEEAYPGLTFSKCTHVWRAINPYTNAVYGYGGVKLFPKGAFADTPDDTVGWASRIVDMTSEIARRGYHYYAVDSVSNETRFATTEFNAWKGAYRECVKLASGVATDDARTRLNSWKNADNGEFSDEIKLGAKMGENYGSAFINEPERLKKINHWEWLGERFEARNDWTPSSIRTITPDFLDGRYMLSGIEMFCVWAEHPDIDMISKMTKAVKNSDKHFILDTVFTLAKDYRTEHLGMFIQYIYSGLKNKFNPERCIHYMFETHEDKAKIPFFGPMMGAVVNNKDANYVDALSKGQVESKLWLVDELEKLNIKRHNSIIIGGWLGISALWLSQKKLIRKISNIDLDETSISFSNELNKYNHQYKEGIVGDINEFDLDDYDFVINTSAEHMNGDWYEKIKPGTLVAIQTNDFHDIEEHINTVNNVMELKKKYKMSEELFVGIKDLRIYNRFMIIGIK